MTCVIYIIKLKIENRNFKFSNESGNVYANNFDVNHCAAGLRGKILDFNQRLEISIDVAHALTYLHLYSGLKIFHFSAFKISYAWIIIVFNLPILDNRDE